MVVQGTRESLLHNLLYSLVRPGRRKVWRDVEHRNMGIGDPDYPGRVYCYLYIYRMRNDRLGFGDCQLIFKLRLGERWVCRPELECERRYSKETAKFYVNVAPSLCIAHIAIG